MLRIRFHGSVPLAATLSVMLAATAAAQSGAPQFRTTVEVVQLQVGVTDDAGEFVSGLQPEDFVLEINGQRRPVQLVYEVDLRRDEQGGGIAVVDGTPQPTAPAAPRPVAARRHWLLMFDFSFTTGQGVLRARKAALEFVGEQVHPGDLLGVATYNRYGLRLLTPFTGNHGQALQAVDSLGLVDARDTVRPGTGFEESISLALAEMNAAAGGGGGADLGAALDRVNFQEYVAEVTNYTEQVRQFGEMLQAIEGRKHVVMFSAGFQDFAFTGQTLGQMALAEQARSQSPAAFAGDAETMFGSPEVRDGLDEMVKALRNADAVVHAIDPTGLRAPGVHDASRLQSELAGSNFAGGAEPDDTSRRTGHQMLASVAEGTGGSANWQANDLTVALAEIEDATSSFYMLAYRKEPGDDDTVSVKVEMARDGVRVVSAPTRLTPPPAYADMNEMQRQLQLAEFMNDDVDRREIAFESQLVPFPASAGSGRVALVLEVPGTALDELALARGEEVVTLEIGGFALAADNAILDSFRRTVTINVGRMREQGDLQQQSFRYSDYVDTPPGEHRLRLLLRESEVGRLSSRTQRYWIPEPSEEPALSRPMVLASLTLPTPPSEDDGRYDPLNVRGRKVLPVAAPDLAAGESFRVLLVLYNVRRDPDTGRVLAGVLLEAVDIEGDAYPLTEMEILGSTFDESVNATQLLIEAQLPPHVRPGTGSLWARLMDQVSGERVEQQTSIFVRPS